MSTNTSTTATAATTARLVILLSGAETADPRQALVALRYAVTAAALDVAVELHAVSASVALLRRDACAPALREQIRQAIELGAALYVCPVALAEQGLGIDDLIAEVAGVRGAPSLLVAGLAAGARFMVF